MIMPLVLEPADLLVALLSFLAMQRGEMASESAIADTLSMSQTELDDRLAKLRVACLYSKCRQAVNLLNLADFLVCGVRYSFPAEEVPGAWTGVPTAWSTAPLSSKLVVHPDGGIVWPKPSGLVTGGFAIEPLDARAVALAEGDPDLHQWLALVDAMRVGRARDRNLATAEIRARLGVA